MQLMHRDELVVWPQDAANLLLSADSARTFHELVVKNRYYSPRPGPLRRERGGAYLQNTEGTIYIYIHIYTYSFLYIYIYGS